MADIINFTNYDAATEILTNQPAPDTYGSLALALENNPGWSVIEGGKTVVEPVTGASKVVPLSNYVQTAAELEGGVVGATEAVEVAETGVVAGEVAAGTSGIFATWTIGTAVAGILAGTGIGLAAYDLSPEFWVDVSNAIFPGEDIKYDEIKDYSILGLIKEEIIGTSPAQNTTYLSRKLAEAVINAAAAHNVYSKDCSENIGQISTDHFNFHDYPENIPYIVNYADKTDTNFWQFYPIGNSGEVRMFIPFPSYLLAMSEKPFSGISQYMNGNHFSDLVNVFTTTSHNGKTYYYLFNGIYSTTPISFNPQCIGLEYNYYQVDSRIHDFATMMDEGITHSNRPAGVYELPNSPQIYDPTSPLTLPQQYPNWIGDREIETHGIEYPYDDPSLYPIPWIPVQMPEWDPYTNPERYPTPGQEPRPGVEPEPQNQPDAQKAKMPKKLPIPDTYPDPTDLPRKTPTGDTPDPVDPTPPVNPTPTPPIVFPTIGGEANALFTVYNPTLAQLNSLAGVLWTSNFLENLIKIFTNNPMDAVISLHMLYATPHTSSSKEIKLGCYPTGVSALEVDKQYIQIDCGTVRIPEYFGDVRDYVNSVVDVYLPFVGMRHLKTQDIVGSYVTIKAGIDVFTGTILYTINIRKTSGINQVMYAFEGNCAVALPLTGADKSRMFSVLGAAATGGAIGGVGGAVVGAFTSVMNGSQQADIQRSGNFGANSGAMGVKKPYIVVSRNTPYDAQSYSYFHGYPANKTVVLGSCNGFTRVLDCRVDGISGATDTEKRMIEEALKRGVII